MFWFMCTEMLKEYMSWVYKIGSKMKMTDLFQINTKIRARLSV